MNLNYTAPLEPLNFGSYQDVWIKRDDLIDPFISGNKWRKLKFTLQDAKSKGCSLLVSFGGAYSNHVLALSAAAARFGFDCTCFIRGNELESRQNPMLHFAAHFGARLIFVDREAYRNKKSLFDRYFGHDAKAYFIDEGGFSKEAALGSAEILDELQEETFDEIFMASGTGCTAAGLLNAIHFKKLKSSLHAVVVHKQIEEVRQNIGILTKHDKGLNLVPTTEFGNYGQHTDELLQFCIDFTRVTGIMIDPVYTGKALFKMYQHIEQNQSSNHKYLFIHTGGIFGNLGKIASYEKLL
jgi:1-aminocyclopropane-1-carboxylate deaminase